MDKSGRKSGVSAWTRMRPFVAKAAFNLSILIWCFLYKAQYLIGDITVGKIDTQAYPSVAGVFVLATLLLLINERLAKWDAPNPFVVAIALVLTGVSGTAATLLIIDSWYTLPMALIAILCSGTGLLFFVPHVAVCVFASQAAALFPKIWARHRSFACLVAALTIAAATLTALWLTRLPSTCSTGDVDSGCYTG